ncbi:MAG: segregation/condensation protein A, partial [Dehalococcoidia bacterium]|nr:segregation/condensation protein A [Dehalococcoidia bacterium]
MSYQIELENFSGPLDLLLFFIRRDEVDIMDIPIAHITKEYLDYIEALQTLNVTVAGDFMVMAATLMRIKAKMLLPSMSEGGDEELDDPRTTL